MSDEPNQMLIFMFTLAEFGSKELVLMIRKKFNALKPVQLDEPVRKELSNPRAQVLKRRTFWNCHKLRETQI